eukprot:3132607-Rhodomonas_salina.4
MVQSLCPKSAPGCLCTNQYKAFAPASTTSLYQEREWQYGGVPRSWVRSARKSGTKIRSLKANTHWYLIQELSTRHRVARRVDRWHRVTADV